MMQKKGVVGSFWGAQEQIQITGHHVRPGDAVALPVHLECDQGATSIEFQLNYDPYSPSNPDGTGADIHNPDTDGDQVPDAIEIASGFGFADPTECLAFGGDPQHPAMIRADRVETW